MVEEQNEKCQSSPKTNQVKKVKDKPEKNEKSMSELDAKIDLKEMILVIQKLKK